MQTDALIEGMNALGYKVANLSQRELSHGYDVFLERRKKARFEFISANVVWQDSGEPIVSPTTVVRMPLRAGAKVKDVRIGFIGLSRADPAFQKEGPGGRRIVTVDPIAAAAKHVAALKQKADIVVALVALDLEQARRLPKTVKDIDLVVGADSAPGRTGMITRSDDFPEATQFGRTRLLFAGDQGKVLGEVRLFFDTKRSVTSTQRTIIQLTREWPDDPKLAELMDKVKVAINEFNKQKTLAESPFAAPAATPAPQEAAYTGSERCAPCHEAAFAVWAKSGHARAFETLVRAKQDFNPKCLPCHTIGYNQKGGYVNPQATPHFENVGCEACHGPSSLHPEPTQSGYGKVDVTFCVTCHTRENSPDYVPAEYIPKVIHWREPQTGR
jgi:cytochrome c554/c'-like protein